MSSLEELQQAIAVLESQRPILGDLVVNAAVAGLKQKIAELQAQPAAQQRKQVTILFADVSGFTSLSEKMDAEEVHDLMNSLWLRLDAIIQRHGGKIDKHIGDAVLALWGVAGTREDDTEQALRAALAMQTEIANLALPIPSGGGVLRMRIGVHSGLVLFGAVGTQGEVSVTGDAVNLASRLQTAAPLGGVLISHEAFLQVRGLFDMLPQPPLMVKGKSEPLTTYVVQRARARAFRMATRGVEGVETHMVGRDAEFAQLKQLFAQVVEQGQAHVVVVRGEAGIGKSRLLHEFEKWLESHEQVVTAFRGRATPEMVHVPYGIWRDLFRNRFDIFESDSAELARQKFNAGMSGFLQAEQAQWVGALVGFDFADSRVANVLGSPNFARTARAYLLAYLRGIARQNPLVLFFEDIHWADEASLELMAQLSEELAGERVLCVALSRPALFERLPQWGAGQALLQIELHPLSLQDSERLVREILAKVADLPEALCEMVVQNADGNPFYVEELIKVLLDDGVIRRGEDAWQVEMERLQRTRIPSTLTELLQARLDSLPPAEAELLQRASVLGRVFWDAALEKLHAPGERLLQVPPLLKAVMERELIYQRERAAFAGMREYTFKHALLRDVAYHMVLLKLRRIYHRQAAEWLEAVGGARLNEYAGVIAGHYEQAGAAAEAVSWFERAGEVALRASAPAQALNAFDRAWKLLSEAPDEQIRLRLLLGRGRAFERMGDYGAALEQYAQAEAEAQSRGALWIEALGALGGIQMRLGQYNEAQATIERQIEQAQLAGDEMALAQAFRTLGSLAYYQGNYAEAIERIRQALALEVKYQRKTGMSSCLSSLGVIAWMQGDFDNAKTWLNESLQLNREIGDPSGMAAALTNLGLVLADEGDFEAAMNCYQQAMAIEQQVGNRRGLCGLLNNIGNLYSSMGDAEQAQRYYEQGLPLARKIGDPTVTSRLLMNLGWGAVLRGELDLAQQYTRESLQMMREIGDREGEATCLQNLAYALCGAGDCAMAEQMLRQALQIATEIEVPSLVLECLAGFGYVFAVEGLFQRSAELIGLALSHAQTNSDVSMAAEFGLGVLRRSLSEEGLSEAMQRGAALDLQAVTKVLLE